MIVSPIHDALAAGVAWEEFSRLPPPSAFANLAARLRALLFETFGIALVRAPSGIGDDAMRSLFLVLGRSLGRVVMPHVRAAPRPLFAVTATDDPTIGGTYGGNARNAKHLPLHTDGSGIHSGRVDVLGMLCMRAADSGGASRLADARVVYAELDDGTRGELATPSPRTDPYAPHLPVEDLVCRPILVVSPEGEIRLSYHPHRVRDGLRLRDGGTLAPPIDRALTSLDDALDRSAVEIPLRRGDMLLVNNWVVAHGRTAFLDDLARPRLLERLWIEIDPPGSTSSM